jgi:hypothetical protein
MFFHKNKATFQTLYRGAYITIYFNVKSVQ